MRTRWFDRKSIRKNYPPYADKTKYGDLVPPFFMVCQYRNPMNKARAVNAWRKLTKNQQKKLKKTFTEMAANARAWEKEQSKAQKALEKQEKAATKRMEKAAAKAQREEAKKQREAEKAARKQVNDAQRNKRKREARAAKKLVSTMHLFLFFFVTS